MMPHPAGFETSSKSVVRFEEIDRTAGLVYPRAPTTPGLREEIEAEAEAYGISVGWFDEPPPKRSPAWRAWQAMQRGEF
jgi:hypothetical protein